MNKIKLLKIVMLMLAASTVLSGCGGGGGGSAAVASTTSGSGVTCDGLCFKVGTQPVGTQP